MFRLSFQVDLQLSFSWVYHGTARSHSKVNILRSCGTDFPKNYLIFSPAKCGRSFSSCYHNHASECEAVSLCCLYLYTFMCVHAWSRGQTSSLTALRLIFETGFLTESIGYTVWPESLGIPVPATPVLGTTPGSYVGAGDLNSGLHAWVTCTFPPEPPVSLFS